MPDNSVLQQLTFKGNLGEKIEVHSYPWMIMGELQRDKQGYYVRVAGGDAGLADVRIGGYSSFDRVEGILRLFL